jgi:hypothetical protein
VPGGSEMTGKLQPGMVVRAASREVTSFDGYGVILSQRERPNDPDPVFLVQWADAAESEQGSVELIRPGFHQTLRAGNAWEDWTVEEVDLTAEVMKVRVFVDKPPIWIDVRLFGLTRRLVRAAAEAREVWLEEGRQKLDWFKPGQIVNNSQGHNALARAATVIDQLNNTEVRVITGNGIATVPFEHLTLSANSVQDLQAKEAQKREAVLDRFKTEVREKAMDAKEEHDLCDEGVREFLDSLGIKIPVNKVRAVLHLTVEVDAVVTQGTGMSRLDLDRSLNREWWGNTFKFDDDGRDLTLKDDDDLDMGEVEVRLISSRIEEIHDESYLEE